MAVGNINSDAKGSGARFNDGKVPLELLPLELVADYFLAMGAESKTLAMNCLKALGRFQAGGGVDDLRQALRWIVGSDFEPCARVFDYGRRKYAEWNWAKGMAWSIPIACAARHLIAIQNGEVDDPESGLPHRGHAACNIVMLLTYVHTFPEGDDRPTTLGALLNGPNEAPAPLLASAFPAIVAQVSAATCTHCQRPKDAGCDTCGREHA